MRAFPLPFSYPAGPQPTLRKRVFHPSVVVALLSGLLATLATANPQAGGLAGNAVAAEVADVPTIVVQPSSLTGITGQTTTLNVTASGTGPLTYQWYKYGAALTGATDASLTIANTEMSDAGDYTVSVTDGTNLVMSAPARIDIAPPSYANVLRPRASFAPLLEWEGGTAEVIVAALDGKFLVAGSFARVDGVPVPNFARFNADGTRDSSFAPPIISGGLIEALAIQPDGRIVIGGSFTSVDGVDKVRIARLNAEGGLDPTLDPGSGFNSSVSTLALQSDGKILAGGYFTSYDGNIVGRIVRIETDGTRDATFGPATTFNRTVDTIVVQADDKILVGGDFFTFNNSTAVGIVRLDADGFLDSTFSIGTFTGRVFAVAIQSDGRVIIGGLFSQVQGTSRICLARLMADGTLDPSLDPGTGFNDAVHGVTLQTAGKIVAAGNFTTYNNAPANYITRLDANGGLDPSFAAGTGLDDVVRSVAVGADDKILVAGGFQSYNGVNRNAVARLQSDGSLDETYTTIFRRGGSVTALAPVAGGRWLIAGYFHWVNGVSRKNIARLESDGSLDTTFDPGNGFNDFVRALVVQGDGRVVVGGAFTNFDGSPASKIARLDEDGSFDPTFVSTTGFNGDVYTLALQADGRIIAGGAFTSYDGTSSNRIARLLTDGSLDATFAVGTGFNNQVQALAVEVNGAIVAGGFFPNYQNTSRNRIARLQSDGVLDASFNPGTGFNTLVNALAVGANGEISVGGVFTAFAGAPANRIVRLNSTGARDASFDPGTGLNNGVNSLGQQADGSIVAGGYFTTVDGAPAPILARIRPDGTLDPSFQITGVNLTPTGSSVAVQRFTAEGGLLIGGSWYVSPTYPAGGLVLLEPVPAAADVTLGDLDRVYSGDPKTVEVTTTPAGLPVVVTYNGSATPPVNAGSYTVVATIDDPGFEGTASDTLTIAKATQSITFNTPPPMAATAAPFAVAATTTSGLPVIFSVVSGPATITGDIVTVTGAGTVMLRASQAGNFNYHADQVDRSFIVSKAPASVSLSVVAFVFDGSPKDATATTMPAGLAVDFNYDGSSITPLNAGTYDLLATINEPNYTGSAAGTLTINPAPAGFVIAGTAQPFDGAPKPVTITTTPVGMTTSVTYNGSTTVPSQIGTYDVIVTVEEANYTGSATATLVIAPGINPGQSGPLVVSDGGETTLTVSSAGIDPAATFQWQIEVPISGPSQVGPSATQWIDISSATNASYHIASTQRFNDGHYRVVITTNGVSVVSLPLTVTVAPSPSNTARLLNLSTRAQALTGDDVLIPGFVIAGTGTKKLLIRAVGPTLGKPPFNLSGVLADPTMRLLKRNPITNAFEEFATNDNWATNANAPAITQTAADVFAFGLDDALESALLMDLAPGEYTAIAGPSTSSGQAATTGLAIVELYDADTGTPTARLANISNRGFAGVGDQVMIPGFVVSSEGPKTLLVRVVGPTLGGFGVPNTMVDPKLEVFPSGENTPILTNDNWGDNPDAAYTATIAQQVQAFALTAGSKDAAFVVTLPPGGYTVVGSSAAPGGTGVVLVEVYVVP